MVSRCKDLRERLRTQSSDHHRLHDGTMASFKGIFPRQKSEVAGVPRLEAMASTRTLETIASRVEAIAIGNKGNTKVKTYGVIYYNVYIVSV